MEHYVTLFDHKFLPQGMALHSSLLANARPCTLWVVCMDERVERELKTLDLPDLKRIPLQDLESDALKAAKSRRSWGEYCWTLTPYSCLFVLNHGHDVNRVTYLDADLFFFGSPSPIFRELTGAKKQVLITEHAFDT